MLLNDLLDYGDLLRMRAEGYVKEQTHPDFPELRILNYTQKAQFDNMWNDVTEICRGLIYNAETGKILARPFRKFFNYNQPGAPDLSLDTEIVAMDKMDGSLGIVYPLPFGKFAVATRGSFASDQAIHATKVLNEKYGDWLEENFAALQLVTPLFEIVYPENRIVCDYKGLDDLVLIGAEVLASKNSTWDADQAKYFFDWTGPTAEIFDYDYFNEALAAKPREGAEGLVVFIPKTGQRVKIKQDDYIALHRIVTGLNARTVWEHLKNYGDLDKFIEDLPDEFHDWVREVGNELKAKFANLMDQIEIDYLDVMDSVRQVKDADSSIREVRATFAHFAKLSSFKSFLFQHLDGKNYDEKVWEILKPEGNVTPSGKVITEDNS